MRKLGLAWAGMLAPPAAAGGWFYMVVEERMPAELRLTVLCAGLASAILVYLVLDGEGRRVPVCGGIYTAALMLCAGAMWLETVLPCRCDGVGEVRAGSVGGWDGRCSAGGWSVRCSFPGELSVAGFCREVRGSGAGKAEACVVGAVRKVEVAVAGAYEDSGAATGDPAGSVWPEIEGVADRMGARGVGCYPCASKDREGRDDCPQLPGAARPRVAGFDGPDRSAWGDLVRCFAKAPGDGPADGAAGPVWRGEGA